MIGQHACLCFICWPASDHPNKDAASRHLIEVHGAIGVTWIDDQIHNPRGGATPCCYGFVPGIDTHVAWCAADVSERHLQDIEQLAHQMVARNANTE